MLKSSYENLTRCEIFTRSFSWCLLGAVLLLLLPGSTVRESRIANGQVSWIAGDHHIHSRFSVSFNTDVDPFRATPILGGGAIYPIPMNALMARRFGLSWMVATDHGGPNHSKVNLERAYPELIVSREEVPDVIQFFGLELNPPGADHSSLIIPHHHGEAQQLYVLESKFDRLEVFPFDEARNTEAGMIDALNFMKVMEHRPVLIANHPSRSAQKGEQYGLDDPSELRKWNDTAPDVAVGMAGAPGHQASTLNPDGSIDLDAHRGGYSRLPTRGGFDPMTAKLGGFWDSMLGEGRQWWITSNSDSHVHFTEGGSDFWPGEYSKTYVHAEKTYASVLEGIRSGHVFVTTGDLISELYISVESAGKTASIGESLEVDHGNRITVEIRFYDPEEPNHNQDTPEVDHVDLIVGEITGPLSSPSQDSNSSTKVVKRFEKDDWSIDGQYRKMTYTLEDVRKDLYFRVRGANTTQFEPEPDPKGEDPWTDLWFYSNPVFLRVR
ncbi:MAG: phosphoesterase [Planctomycetota bacterium]|nr:phosphoesterase [Planctomycetota bacterium]